MLNDKRLLSVKGDGWLPSFPSVVWGIAKSAYKYRQNIMAGFDKGFNGGR